MARAKVDVKDYHSPQFQKMMEDVDLTMFGPEDFAVLIPGSSRGGTYMEILRREMAPDLLSGAITQTEAAKQIGVSQVAVSKALQAIREDMARRVVKEEWDKEQERIEREGKWPLIIPLYELDDEKIWKLVEYFETWRKKHFRTRTNEQYQTPPHQKRWLFAIFRAIRDGRNLLILSPPRHGKTELMMHLDTFIISRVNPNVMLVKVCKSEELASRAVGSVLDTLSESDSLKEECLPSGFEFKPDRGSRRQWNNHAFTTATRNITGLKSPTMTAVGSQGTLLSRDGDVFTLDDIEDHQTVGTPEFREKTRTWLANDLMSRKESHTAIIAIGSRQHPDDCWGYLLRNPEWECIVEQIHDDANCEVEDPENPDNYHKHQECMLWPEIRDYEWMVSIRDDPERGKFFEMIYQNKPVDVGVANFTRELLESVEDEERVTGQWPREPWIDDRDESLHEIKLIAGLDPAATGYQACFLWGVDIAGFHLYAIDFRNDLGGGIQRAREQISEWFVKYGVDFWVIEKNMYRGGIIQDELLNAYTSKNHITLIDSETGSNKWDHNMGVTALAEAMSKGQISIPAGDRLTKNHWDRYKKQLINFNRDALRNARGRKGVSDIVMASWFPWETIKNWRKEYLRNEEASELMMDSNPFVEMGSMFSEFFPAAYSDQFQITSARRMTR